MWEEFQSYRAFKVFQTPESYYIKCQLPLQSQKLIINLANSIKKLLTLSNIEYSTN